MEATALTSLALACAPAIHTGTATALVYVESSLNPWAIGVVGGQLNRQPRSKAEALATARALQTAGWNFSVGLGQINVRNFARLHLTLESAFDPCTNLAAMQEILADCFDRAGAPGNRSRQSALRRALSCYYSGNFATGFEHGYVQRVVRAATGMKQPIPPALPKEKT
ncbi:lytic transglycosylase domain-containing protein [Roseateles sp. LYH14W]|uniref:Lytic transglycosylase domain-containing protein n=1 Tax=Pelomonas parva TaxID=3299032 RepID=A0ABW7F6H8_9BURK